jgi:hypothetical protein
VKRQGNLWDRMISFESLLLAAHAAARGKRFKPGVARFVFDLERQLLLLHEELASKTYRPGPYRTFTIYEGKTRQISAAPFRDRVVHHALTGVLEPIFERSFIFDSYACRKGKGTAHSLPAFLTPPVEHGGLGGLSRLAANPPPGFSEQQELCCFFWRHGSHHIVGNGK